MASKIVVLQVTYRLWVCVIQSAVCVFYPIMMLPIMIAAELMELLGRSIYLLPVTYGKQIER